MKWRMSSSGVTLGKGRVRLQARRKERSTSASPTCRTATWICRKSNRPRPRVMKWTTLPAGSRRCPHDRGRRPRQTGRGTIWHGQIPNCLHQNHIFRIRANRAQLAGAVNFSPSSLSRTSPSGISTASPSARPIWPRPTKPRCVRFTPVPPTTDEQQQVAKIMQAEKAKLAALIQKEAALIQLKNP